MNRCSILAAALLFALPPSGFAQARLTGADLAGTVLDESGGAMAGVSVTVTNSETNLTRTATTDAKGHYTVAALPPGTYTIAVARSGFATRTRNGVVLLLGQSVTMDFELKVAGTAEELTVTAETPVVEITHTEVSSVVNRQQIESLPINGRNFMSFSVITP
ncbi:MAG TPA: carboxypeptidase-like regulatory domain-containing protein, partial [Vicinamibacteria bacterium]